VPIIRKKKSFLVKPDTSVIQWINEPDSSKVNYILYI
jgi:hypothetical protein